LIFRTHFPTRLIVQLGSQTQLALRKMRNATCVPPLEFVAGLYIFIDCRRVCYEHPLVPPHVMQR
jgi:hypothetical protein